MYFYFMYNLKCKFLISDANGKSRQNVPTFCDKRAKSQILVGVNKLIIICFSSTKTNNRYLLIYSQINQHQNKLIQEFPVVQRSHVVFHTSKLKVFWHFSSMTSSVFEKDFFSRSSRDYETMLKTFQAAVMSARSGSDETIKQVSFFSFKSLCLPLCHFVVCVCHNGHCEEAWAYLFS